MPIAFEESSEPRPGEAAISSAAAGSRPGGPAASDPGGSLPEPAIDASDLRDYVYECARRPAAERPSRAETAEPPPGTRSEETTTPGRHTEGTRIPPRPLAEWIAAWPAHHRSGGKTEDLDIKDAVLNALDQLRRLPANWNGYDAGPIDAQVFDAAKAFVGWIPARLAATSRVVPMTGGRLQIEWHRGNRSLEIEFETPDRIHYLKWDPEQGVEEEDAFPVAETDRIKSLLDWFASE